MLFPGQFVPCLCPFASDARRSDDACVLPNNARLKSDAIRPLVAESMDMRSRIRIATPLIAAIRGKITSSAVHMLTMTAMMNTRRSTPIQLRRWRAVKLCSNGILSSVLGETESVRLKREAGVRSRERAASACNLYNKSRASG